MKLKSVKLGNSWIHLSDFVQVFDEGAKKLRDNLFFFLKEPPNFKYGEIPYDGPISGKDGISNKHETDNINWNGFYLLGKKVAGGDDNELK
jgi:hypothetical protein